MTPDPSKSRIENLLNFLNHLVTPSGVTKTKKLSYLNALVKVWESKAEGAKEDSPPVGQQDEKEEADGTATQTDLRLKELMLW